MLLSVTADKITIKEGEQIESGEYNTTLCQFEFTEEYDDLIKTAVFTRNKDTYKMDIIDNQCYIPDEVLQKKGSIIIGVYGYKVENDTLILRYSPKPVKKTVVTGSYVKNSQNSTPPTPTQFEQYEQALETGLAEVSNVDIDARKVNYTSTITITNRAGVLKQVEVYDGQDGQDGAQGQPGYTPQRGTDYWTNQDKSEIVGMATSTVESDLQPTLTQINTTASEAKSIAEGANQSLSYSDYETMITEFNSLDNTIYRTGQNVMIITLEVPDLWVSSIEETSVTYTYTTDNAILEDLQTNGYIQVGYYRLSALETQKVDLTNYYTKTEDNTLLNAKVDKSSFVYDSTTQTLTITIV